jgi:hypothetical protein
MIPESEEAGIGDGGAKSGPGVEMELSQKPKMDRRLQITFTVTIVLLSVVLLLAGMAAYEAVDAIFGLRQESKTAQDTIKMLQWQQDDLEQKQKDGQDTIKMLQWRQDYLEQKQKNDEMKALLR